MSKDELQWLLLAASDAPIKSTSEARHKAAALRELADQLDEAAKPASVHAPDSM